MLVDDTFSQIHEYDIEKFTRHLNSRDPPCTFSFTRKRNLMESYPSWILAFSSKSVIKDDSYKPWMCRNPLNTVNTSGTKSKVISTNSITPLIKEFTPTTSLSTTGNIWFTAKIDHQGKNVGWLTKYNAWAVMIFYIGETAIPFEESPELFRPHIGCQLLHNP